MRMGTRVRVVGEWKCLALIKESLKVQSAGTLKKYGMQIEDKQKNQI